jgi:CRISPR/Cas system-associated exonuclease Cas4 (RecB family)
MKNLSFSQVNQFMKCPRSWYISKVLREEVPSGDAAARGSMFDQCVAAALGLGDGPEEEITEEVQGAVEFYLEHPLSWKKADVAQKEVTMTPAQWDFFADVYDCAWPLPAPIIGYVDLIRSVQDGLIKEVCDLKTSTRGEYRPEWSLQATLYCLIERAKRFEVHLLTFTKQLKLLRYEYSPTDETFKWAMETIGAISDQISRVERAPNLARVPATAGYHCDWCPRKASCEATNVGRLVDNGKSV